MLVKHLPDPRHGVEVLVLEERPGDDEAADGGKACVLYFPLVSLESRPRPRLSPWPKVTLIGSFDSDASVAHQRGRQIPPNDVTICQFYLHFMKASKSRLIIPFFA